MPDISLSFASTPYDRIESLLTGEVKPDGATLEYNDRVNLADIFYQQLKFQRFDISEMSFSSYMKARAKGFPYLMLPIFHNRHFAYSTMLIRKSSGIRQDHPEDLIGKRIGAADYQMTAALCARGVLQHEFNVKPSDSIWYQERSEHFSHGGASGSNNPAGVTIKYATTDFGTMFLNGELDAAVFYFAVGGGSNLDKERVDLTRHPDFAKLFTDPRAEGIRYFKKTGVYLPHHITVIRESIVKEHPWISVSLMNAFTKAKERAIERTYQRLQRTPSPSSLEVFGMQQSNEQFDVFGADPYPYGVKANAKAIDMLQTFAVDQGFAESKQPWDELFPEEVLLSEEKLG